MAGRRVKTYVDIQNDVMETLKLNTADTTALNRVKRSINKAYVEICGKKRWPFLRKSVALTHKKYINTGTVTIAAGSRSLTFSSAPAFSVEGYLIKFDAHEEIYRVSSHTAASTSAVLESQYTASSNLTAGTYKLWTDELPLPVDCQQLDEVYHQWLKRPLLPSNPQEIKQELAYFPSREGYPLYYALKHNVDPNPYSTATTTTATRASSGLVKTIVFGSDVSSTLEPGDRIKVASAGSASYNGEFVVASVSTTTITYTGLERLSETTTADTGIVVTKLGARDSHESYKSLLVYPSLNSDDITVNVDYIQNPLELEDDTDEPLLPIEDREVLSFKALEYEWNRQRNREAEADARGKAEDKIQEMWAKQADTLSRPNLSVDSQWAHNRRFPRGRRRY